MRTGDILYRSNRLYRKEVENLSVGENIKNLRLNKDITQAELAEQAGITQSMLCQIERGTKNPSLQIACEIAKILKCSTEDFVGECSAPHRKPSETRLA